MGFLPFIGMHVHIIISRLYEPCFLFHLVFDVPISYQNHLLGLQCDLDKFAFVRDPIPWVHLSITASPFCNFSQLTLVSDCYQKNNFLTLCYSWLGVSHQKFFAVFWFNFVVYQFASKNCIQSIFVAYSLVFSDCFPAILSSTVTAKKPLMFFRSIYICFQLSFSCSSFLLSSVHFILC